MPSAVIRANVAPATRRPSVLLLEPSGRVRTRSVAFRRPSASWVKSTLLIYQLSYLFAIVCSSLFKRVVRFRRAGKFSRLAGASQDPPHCGQSRRDTKWSVIYNVWSRLCSRQQCMLLTSFGDQSLVHTNKVRRWIVNKVNSCGFGLSRHYSTVGSLRGF